MGFGWLWDKNKSVFRGWDSLEFCLYSVKWFLSHPVPSSVSSRPSSPWKKCFRKHPVQEGEAVEVQCLQQTIGKIRRWYQWYSLKSKKVFVAWSLWGGSTDVTSYLIWNRNVVGVLGWRKVLNATFLSWNSGKDWGPLAWVSMKIQGFRQLMRSLAWWQW